MKILIATDGSDAAMHAVAEATRILPVATAEVAVVAATDPSLRFGGNEDAAADLVKAEAVLAAAGVKATTIEAKGEPAAAIIETAERLGADLVVIGSTGRSALGRLVMGSVSDAVVRGWRGATLVVKPRA